jgi:hypothetical protein
MDLKDQGDESTARRMPARRDWRALDPQAIQRQPFRLRDNKVRLEDYGRSLTGPARSVWKGWLDSLPNVLAAADLRQLVGRLRECRDQRRAILWLLGGHVIKTGVAPYLIDLYGHGFASAVAMNGAAAIHDVEIALFGRTSEDVARNLADGSFGMAAETGDFFFTAYRAAVDAGCGMGEGIARHLEAVGAPHRQDSLLHAAWRGDIPCTVHVAIGTDIIHQQPGVDGAHIGTLTYRDFLIFAEAVTRLDPEGAVINVGSAVLMPEVFLKALTMARNLGHRPRRLTTANLDMMQHYRPRQNVLARPTSFGGEAIALTGHHEIMIPLLHALLRFDGEEERVDEP